MKKYITAMDMCLHMFVSIPLPQGKWDEDLRRLSTACLPILGLLIGAIWWAIAAIANALLPHALATVIIAIYPFLITGFIHLDGYMDTSDAILSWRDWEEKLRILKDSHVGSFAVVMIAILFLLQAAACASVTRFSVLLLIPALSRCGSAFSVLAIQPLGHSEYANKNEEGSGVILGVLIMTVLGVLGMALCAGWKGLIPAIFVLGSYALHMAYCVRTLGGVSGDLAGFCLTVSELCGLIALCLI